MQNWTQKCKKLGLKINGPAPGKKLVVSATHNLIVFYFWQAQHTRVFCWAFFFPQKTYFLIFRGKLNKIFPLPGLVWTAMPITSVIPGIRGLTIPGTQDGDREGWGAEGKMGPKQTTMLPVSDPHLLKARGLSHLDPPYSYGIRTSLQVNQENREALISYYQNQSAQLLVNWAVRFKWWLTKHLEFYRSYPCFSFKSKVFS